MDDQDRKDELEADFVERAKMVSCVVCGAMEGQWCQSGGICPSRGA